VKKEVWEKKVRGKSHVTSGGKGSTRADIAQLPVAHAHIIRPNMVVSGHVTYVTSGHFWSSMRTVSLPVAPPQI